MKASLLRKYDDKVTAVRQAAAKAEDWERIVVPDPAFPLVSAGWDNERTDIHGIGCTGSSGDIRTLEHIVRLDCYCGHTVTAQHVDTVKAQDAAFALLIEHARATVLVPAA